MNEESPPLPPSLHSSHITSHASYIKITADDKKDINGPPLFSFFLFFLPGRRWCCPPILNDWKQGEQRDTKTRRERERMNESYAEGREKGNRVSALRALGWQTGSWVYYAYEWEGGDTLSLCPSPPLWYTPLPRPGVSVLGSCEAVAPYIDVDVSLCFFWQRFLLHSWQSGER